MGDAASWHAVLLAQHALSWQLHWLQDSLTQSIQSTHNACSCLQGSTTTASDQHTHRDL